MAHRLPFQLLRAWVLLLAGSGALGACSSQGHEPRQDDATALRRPATPSRPAAARSLINLPAGLHLRPAEFGARFGQPQPLAPDFVDPGKASADSAAPADSLALFQPQGLPMIVSFRPGSGRVQDVLLLGADETMLMRQATLEPAAAGYLLLPVFAPRRPDRLIGLRVVPK